MGSIVLVAVEDIEAAVAAQDMTGVPEVAAAQDITIAEVGTGLRGIGRVAAAIGHSSHGEAAVGLLGSWMEHLDLVVNVGWGDPSSRRREAGHLGSLLVEEEHCQVWKSGHSFLILCIP